MRLCFKKSLIEYTDGRSFYIVVIVNWSTWHFPLSSTTSSFPFADILLINLFCSIYCVNEMLLIILRQHNHLCLDAVIFKRHWKFAFEEVVNPCLTLSIDRFSGASGDKLSRTNKSKRVCILFQFELSVSSVPNVLQKILILRRCAKATSGFVIIHHW